MSDWLTDLIDSEDEKKIANEADDKEYNDCADDKMNVLKIKKISTSAPSSCQINS